MVPDDPDPPRLPARRRVERRRNVAQRPLRRRAQSRSSQSHQSLPGSGGPFYERKKSGGHGALSAGRMPAQAGKEGGGGKTLLTAGGRISRTKGIGGTGRRADEDHRKNHH